MSRDRCLTGVAGTLAATCFLLLASPAFAQLFGDPDATWYDRTRNALESVTPPDANNSLAWQIYNVWLALGAEIDSMNAAFYSENTDTPNATVQIASGDAPDDQEIPGVLVATNARYGDTSAPILPSEPVKNGSEPVIDGELIIQDTDITLPGRGIPFTFTRTYRSRVSHFGVLGHGWDHNYNRRIISGVDDCQDVDVMTGDSGRVRFKVTEQGGYYTIYSPPPGVALELTRLVSTSKGVSTVRWVLKTADLTYQFDKDGLLSEIAEPGGNKLTFTWGHIDYPIIEPVAGWKIPGPPDGSDVSWRVLSVKDTTGRTIFLNYNTEFDSHPLKCISFLKDDCKSPLMSYSVDPAKGDLITATDPNGTGKQYAYHGATKTSTYLPDDLADKVCASMCGARNDCENFAVCEKAQDQCVTFYNDLATKAPSLNRQNVCGDELMSSICNVQYVTRTVSGYGHPDTYTDRYNPICSQTTGDHQCATDECLQSSAYWSSGENAGSLPAFCNEQCYARQRCSGTIDYDCKVLVQNFIPFCTTTCEATCRARYQAKDANGNAFHAYGRPEDLAHNLEQVLQTPQGTQQFNYYGEDPADPTFDRVIRQDLQDAPTDKPTENSVTFEYHELDQSPVSVVLDLARVVLGRPTKISAIGARFYERVAGRAAGPSRAAAYPDWSYWKSALKQVIKLFPVSYVDGLDSFHPVDICPATCVKPSYVPRPPAVFPDWFINLPRPPAPIDPGERFALGFSSDATHASLKTLDHAAPNLVAGAWLMSGPSGETVSLISSAPGAFLLDGTGSDIDALFGSAKQMMFQSLWPGGLVLAAPANATAIWRDGWVGLSFGLPEAAVELHIDLGSLLATALKRAGPTSARATALSAVVGTFLKIATDFGDLTLTAEEGGSLRVDGVPQELKGILGKQSVGVSLLENGQLWATTRPLDVPSDAFKKALSALHDWLSDFASPIRDTTDDCAQWSFDAPVTDPLTSSESVQRPTRAVVVYDLHNVVRTEYYDAEGQLIREVNHHVNDAGSAKEVVDYNYDAVSGGLRGVLHSDGRRFCQELNHLGEAVQTTEIPAPSRPGDARERITLNRYDRQHLLTDTVVDPGRSTPLTIHLERNATQIKSVTTQVDGSRKVTTSYKFDALPAIEPREIDYPDGTIAKLDDYLTVGPQTVTLAANDANDPVSFSLGYDSNGRMASISRTGHASGVRFSYDVLGTVQSTGARQPGQDWVDTTFTYKYSRLPEGVNGPTSKKILHRDTRGNLQWTIETSANLSPRSTCFHYSPEGRLESMWLPEGNFRNYFYDDANRPTRTEEGYPATLPLWATACAKDLTSNYHSPPPVPVEQTPLQATRTIEYDDVGRPVRYTNGGGVTYTLTVDGLGRLIDAVDPQGNHHRRGYDSRSRLVWEAMLGPNPPAYARPETLDPSVPLLSMVEYQYDNLDRPIQLDRWHFVGTTAVTPGRLKSTTTYTYDDSTRSVTIQEDDHPSSTYHFDGMGRLVTIKFADGRSATAQYQENAPTGDAVTWSVPGPDGNPRVQTLSYDDFGRVVDVKDSNGILLSHVDYDSFGRLQKQTAGIQQRTHTFDDYGRYTGFTEIADSASRSITYAFDGNDRISSVQDGKKGTTTFVYDTLERLRFTRYADSSSAQWVYVPGLLNLDYSIDRFGTKHEVGYDALGRISGEHVSNPNLPLGAIGVDRSFTFDPFGQILTATIHGNLANPTDGLQTTFSYDSFGRRITDDESQLPLTVGSKWDPNAGESEITISTRGDTAQTATIQKLFDDFGRVKELDFRTAGGNTRTIAKLLHEDGGGAIQYGETGKVVAKPAFDSRAQEVGLDVALNGTLLASLHEALALDGVVRERQRQFGSAATITDYFRLDGAGRVTGENLSTVRQPLLASPAGDLTDALLKQYFDEGSSARGSNFRLYNLDAVGNWLSRTDSSGVHSATFVDSTPAGMNQYDHFGRDSAGTDNAKWTYDAGGAVSAIGQDSYTFDVLGRLTHAEVGGVPIDYGYDALGRRVFERGADVTTQIVWNGDSIIAMGSGDGSQFTISVSGDSGDQRLALVTGMNATDVSYLHQAADGSTLAVTNDAGLVQGYSYSAYGEPTIFAADGAVAPSAPPVCRFLFQGQLYDPTVRAFAMGAREYRSDVGRFLSPDPAEFAGGENFYAFVMSRPLSYVDPTGLRPVQPSTGTPNPNGTPGAVPQPPSPPSGQPPNLPPQPQPQQQPDTPHHNDGWRLPSAPISEQDRQAAINRLTPKEVRDVEQSFVHWVDRVRDQSLDTQGTVHGGTALIAGTGVIIGSIGGAVAELLPAGLSALLDAPALSYRTPYKLVKIVFVICAGIAGVDPELGGAGNALESAGGGGGTGAGAQTFRILDGVRRAKAAQLSGLETIAAEVDVGGRTVAAGQVPISSLLSPKAVIDTVSTPGALTRWLNTLRQTAAGSLPPAIRITPGSTGTPLDLVRIGRP